MITRVRMPKLSENEEEQVITAWFKKTGDTVRRGEPLIEVSASKVAFEVEAPRSGVLRAALAGAKSSLPVGYIVALIGDAREALPDVSAANRKLMERHAAKAQSAPRPEARRAGGGESGVRATPAARRLARERGVDLARARAALNAEVVTESLLTQYLEQAGKRAAGAAKREPERA